MDSPRFGSPSSRAVSVSFSDTRMGSRSVCVTPRPFSTPNQGLVALVSRVEASTSPSGWLSDSLHRGLHGVKVCSRAER